MPCDGPRRAGQRLPLPAGEGRRHLDEMDVDGRVKGGKGARGPQEVGHQRAAAGAELDEPDGLRPAEGVPGLGRPDADQLAEDLADLRGGDEVARRTEGVAAHVVAVARVAEGERHVAIDGKRPLRGDQGPKFRVERRHAGVRRDRSTSQRPTAISGTERSWPMVAPA